MAGLTDEQREALRQEFQKHGYDPDVAEQHINAHEQKLAKESQVSEPPAANVAGQQISDYGYLQAPAAAGAAGGAAYGAKKLYDSLSHKMSEKAAQPEPIEPKMYESQVRPSEPFLEPEAGSKATMEQTKGLSAQEQEMIAKSEQAKVDKAQIAERKATKEKIAEVQAKLAAEAPEGMRPNYIKNAQNPIGPGGYNWLYGQEGENAKAIWEEQYGKRNVPYKQVREDYSAAKRPPTMTQVEKNMVGGQNARPQYIPEYIRGSVAPKTLIPLAGTALTAMAATQAIKHGLKTGDWGPAGELGLNIGAMAVNPALGFLTHMSGAGEGEEQELARRRYEAAVGGGRGIAPPSAYPR